MSDAQSTVVEAMEVEQEITKTTVEVAAEESLVKNDTATTDTTTTTTTATTTTDTTTVAESDAVVESESVAETTTTIAEPRKRNIKFDASLLPESDDPAEMRKQVEFYFSDSNLPFDKFLWSLVTKDNKPVPVKLIASFKRMVRFKDHEKIVAALRDSTFLDVGGDEGDETIKRKEALDVNRASIAAKKDQGEKVKNIFDKALKTSMYAKGFGEETPTTQIDVEKLMEPCGPINSVRLRRDDRKVFKGSVFIEFGNVEALRKFAQLDDKPEFNGQSLEWKTKEQYVEDKLADIAAGRIQPNRPKVQKFNAFRHEKTNGQQFNNGGRNQRGGRGNRGGNRGRGGRDRGGRGGRGRAAPSTKRGNSPPVDSKVSVTDQTSVSEGINKRKADDSGAEPEAKKPRED